MGILYSKGSGLKIEVYKDVDCVGFVFDKSTLGYCIFVESNLKDARSNVEVEFRSMAHKICKLQW